MNQKLALAITTILALATPANSYALSSSATGTASATITQRVAISHTQDLNFGSFTADNSPSFIEITEGSTQNTAVYQKGNNVSIISNPVPGVFLLTGPSTIDYANKIQVESPVIIRSDSDQMSVTPAVVRIVNTDNIGNNGQIIIGGRLEIGAQQTPGLYQAEYAVTVNY